MNRIGTLLVVTAIPLSALAQNSPSETSAPAYQPVVPAPSMVNAYGGWPGYSGGGTVAGSALNGMANVISAKGDYNLSTSAAAVNATQAQRNEIQNRQLWTNAYFDMRAANRAAREAERGPAPTMEQIARMAQQGLPKPLAPSELDPIDGRIYWPSALQDAAYESQRAELEKLFVQRVRYGGLGGADQATARRAIESMYDQLKTQVREMPPAEYVACRNFLDSLSYAATKMEL